MATQRTALALDGDSDRGWSATATLLVLRWFAVFVFVLVTGATVGLLASPLFAGDAGASPVQFGETTDEPLAPDSLQVDASATPLVMNESVEITTRDDFSVPEETVTVEGEEFRVDSISRLPVGATVAVTVSAPAVDRYELNLYTLEETIQTFRTGEGTEAFEFTTGTDAGVDAGPGSYVLAVVDNQDFKAVQPVVVADQAVTLAAPTAVESGEELSVSATIESFTEQTTPASVELVVWNDETQERIELEEVTDGTYEGGVADLPIGTYDVYAAVIDEEEVGGEENFIGLSESLTVEVSETVASVEHQETTPLAAGNETIAGDDSTDRDDGVGADGDGAGGENDSNDVLRPSADDGTDDADGDGAGFGFSLAIVGVTLLVLLGRSR